MNKIKNTNEIKYVYTINEEKECSVSRLNMRLFQKMCTVRYSINNIYIIINFFYKYGICPFKYISIGILL